MNANGESGYRTGQMGKSVTARSHRGIVAIKRCGFSTLVIPRLTAAMPAAIQDRQYDNYHESDEHDDDQNLDSGRKERYEFYECGQQSNDKCDYR